MSSPQALAQSVLPALLDMSGGRKLIAVAGPPGAGKSTISDALCSALTAAGRTAAVIPMDGFHLDNPILAQRGLLDRKGAPQTFDANGFVSLVQRAADGGDLFYPVFDRDRDIAIAGAGFLSADIEFAVFEGNYLLLDQAPWTKLHALWRLTLWADPGLDTLKHRLLQRWLDHGLTQAQAIARRDQNDVPNAITVRDTSVRADVALNT